MEQYYIPGRAALDDATQLMTEFGDDAGFEAASRADHSRDLGNVLRYCHWRQIERVIAVLASDDVIGRVH